MAGCPTPKEKTVMYCGPKSLKYLYMFFSFMYENPPLQGGKYGRGRPRRPNKKTKVAFAMFVNVDVWKNDDAFKHVGCKHASMNV